MKNFPHDMESEQGLIGCLFHNNDLFDAIDVRPEEFFYPVHGRIYAEIERLIQKNQNASPVTLKNFFKDDPDLEELGGADYLSDLAANIYSTFNIRDYARTVKDLYRRRRVIELSEEVIAGADNYSIDIMAFVEERLTLIADDSPTSLCTAGESVTQAMQWISDVRNGKIVPYETGFERLDAILTGLYPAGLYVIAGRPGMGKTAIMLNIAENISIKKRSLVLSLEMRAMELGMRLVAGRTGISVKQQRQAKDLTREQWNAIKSAQSDLSGLNMHIEDAARCNMATIASMARRHKRKYGEFVLFIDYLGLIGTSTKIDKKVYQIEEITNGLKAIAKELNIPVVLLSQLSRAVEGRDNKRPMKSDLRDSGSIEQDADVIIFPYRPEYYHEREKPEQKAGEDQGKFIARMADWEAQKSALAGKAEIIVAKNRNGEEATALMSFDGKRQKFY